MKLLLCVVLLCECIYGSFAEQGCGGKPADVVFVLDSSASIGRSDFQKQIKFTRDVINLFDIGADKTRVGITLFSTNVYPVFGLTEFSNKRDMVSAIGSIDYMIGGTGTDKALRYIREHEFRVNSRPEIPQIAIVLTDGQSYDRDRTIQEAILDHAAGIIIFVIGIGDGVDKKELSVIASDPDEMYLFEIGNYSALQKIKETLAIQTCKVEYVKGTPPPIDVMPDFSLDPSQCTFNMIVGVDTNGVSTRYTKTILSFLSDMTDKLSDGPGKFRTSQIMTQCADSSRKVRSKSYAPLIKNMRYQAPKNTRLALSVGLLVINSRIGDLGKVMSEAKRGRFSGFRLVVINVGNTKRENIISRILGLKVTSGEFIKRVFTVPTYTKLPLIMEDVTRSLAQLGTCV